MPENTISLKEYMVEKFDSLEKAQKARDKIADERNAAYIERFDELEASFKPFADFKTRSEAQIHGIKWLVGAVIAFFGAALSVVIAYFNFKA